MRKWRTGIMALLATGFGAMACTTPSVDRGDAGKVSGMLMVFWDGEDNFIYYPYYKDPLVYRLPKQLAKRLGKDGVEIRPGAIYTDGGSIPRAVRNWAGLSPWGYGPAYIVHDWLFIAHHCIVHDATYKLDARDADEIAKVEKVDFQMSADILANVIQALVNQEKVPKRDFAPGAIYTAVDSGIARGIWNSQDPSSCTPPTHEKIRQIEAKLRAGPRFAAAPPAVAGQPVLVYQQQF